MKKIYYIIGLLTLMVVAVQAQTLTLEVCKQMALENNYELKNRYLEQQASSQSRREAFTNFFPKISAIGGYMGANKGLVEMQGLNPATGEPMLNSFLKNGKFAALTFIQPVFAGGQIINGNKLARIGEEVSVLQATLTEEQVEKKTEHYFWQVVQLEEKLKTIGAMEELLKTIRKDVEVAIQAGVTTRNDLLRVELQEYELESNRLKLENGIKTSKLLLLQLIGLKEKEVILKYEAVQNPESPLDLYVNASDAVLSRPETAMLDYNIKANKLQKKLEVGKRLPTVGVGASYFYHDLLDSDYNAGVVMANVSIPISDWWGGSHAIKRQSLKLKQAENERQNNIELLTVQIEQSWNELQESYKQVLLAQKSIASSEENMRMNHETYRAGTITLSDLLEAQSLLQQSKDQYVEAYTNYKMKETEYRILTNQELN